MAERTQILAAVTHDLKTPMTRMLLRLEHCADAALKEKLCADLAAMQALADEGLELARSMNYYAAVCVEDGRFDPTAAARAKMQIGRSGKHIAQEAIQMHGGIGVTAEYPIAHYAAKLTAIDQTLGSATDHLRYLCGRVGDYGVVSL